MLLIWFHLPFTNKCPNCGKKAGQMLVSGPGQIGEAIAPYAAVTTVCAATTNSSTSRGWTQVNNPDHVVFQDTGYHTFINHSKTSQMMLRSWDYYGQIVWKPLVQPTKIHYRSTPSTHVVVISDNHFTMDNILRCKNFLSQCFPFLDFIAHINMKLFHSITVGLGVGYTSTYEDHEPFHWIQDTYKSLWCIVMVAKSEEGLGVKIQILHNIDFNQISLKNKYVGYRWLLAINMQHTGSYTLKIITCQ